MNKLISITLITLFVGQSMTPNMDLCCELQKLPELFTHFDLHQQSEGDSFFEFVNEHVFNSAESNHEHANGASHEDLPFHGSHHCSHAPLAFVTATSDEFSVIEYSSTRQYSTFVSAAPMGYSESPFQPPKG